VVKLLQAKWDELEKALPLKKRSGKPKFSWDNCRAHGGRMLADEERWQALDILPCEHTMLPPYSGDMHCVIEGTHALLMSKVVPAVNSMTSTTLEPYIELTQRLFYETCTVEKVQRATHRLYMTVLPAILEESGKYSQDSQKR